MRDNPSDAKDHASQRIGERATLLLPFRFSRRTLQTSGAETALAGAGREVIDCEEQNREEENLHRRVCSSKLIRDLCKKAA